MVLPAASFVPDSLSDEPQAVNVPIANTNANNKYVTFFIMNTSFFLKINLCKIVPVY